MWKITAEKAFEAGHRLIGYKGKCSRLHGHNYRALVTLAGEELQENWGALVDFGTIKKWLGKLCDKWDHRVILQDCKENRKIFKNFPKDWIVWTKFNPTAEEMAKYLFMELDARMLDEFGEDVWVDSLTVYETLTNAATYTSETYCEEEINNANRDKT